MRRIVIALTIVFAGLLSLGSLAASPPAAHAQIAWPAVSSSASSVPTGGSVIISGRNYTPNYLAYVYYMRPDGTAGAVWVSTTPTGMFSLTLGFLASHGTGTEYVAAYDYATGRWSPFTTIAVTGPVAPTRQLSVSATMVVPGNTITVSGQAFTPNYWVYVYFVRPDNTAGAVWVFTNAGGGFSLTLGFLASHGYGTETIWAYDYATGQWSAPTAVTVKSS